MTFNNELIEKRFTQVKIVKKGFTRVAQNLQKLKNELFTDGIRFLNILEAQNDMAQISSFFVHLAQSTSILSKKVHISSFS